VGTDELDAAGIRDPGLRRSYLACRRLNATHGRTYYLATSLLPAPKRPAVHALYGFARRVDDIVDDVSSPLSREAKQVELAGLEAALLGGGHDGDDHDVVIAARDTMVRYGIDPQLFADFLTAMRLDLNRTGYDTYDDLLSYMHGSAGVIGLQMLPILGTVVPPEVAEPYAYELGIAFQLANFVRDVGEDLRRGRVYLPAEDLARFGVTREQLVAGVVDDPFQELLAFEIARARRLFASSRHGIRLLASESRQCVQAAWRLYGGILDAVERADYRVLDRRVKVGIARRAAVALPALARNRLRGREIESREPSAAYPPARGVANAP
jgi:phytoene synthase